MFNLYSEFFTKGTLERFGDVKTGQVILTVKYTDDFVLLAKEETVLQGVTDRLTESGRCYAVGMNVEETKVTRI